MMLLGALAENIFGFSGTYARKKQASLDLILTGWKRWMEFNTTSDDQIPRTGWLLNLRISGSISMNKRGKSSIMERGTSWVQRQQGGQEPLVICLQDVRIPKRRKNSVKRELQRVFPHYWIYISTAQSSKKDCRDRPYVFSVLIALHSAFFPKSRNYAAPIPNK